MAVFLVARTSDLLSWLTIAIAHRVFMIGGRFVGRAAADERDANLARLPFAARFAAESH
jgi:hypothetical protein